MGAPRRNRQKYDRPKDIRNSKRITEDNAMIKAYGLGNMKELWKVQSEISRIRGNVRKYLAGSGAEGGKALIARLSKLGIVKPEAMLDDILDLKEIAFLERRLQSVVMRKGLSRSMKQARQLVTHGFISINGKKVDRPGYIVGATEETAIGYYKKIDIQQKQPAASDAAAIVPVEIVEAKTA
jgi:small subunit ribosomal protein S4